jgi:hypothetical protein
MKRGFDIIPAQPELILDIVGKTRPYKIRVKVGAGFTNNNGRSPTIY